MWEKSLDLGSNKKINVCLEFNLEIAHLSQTSPGWPWGGQSRWMSEKKLNWTKQVSTKTWPFPCSRNKSRHVSFFIAVLLNSSPGIIPLYTTIYVKTNKIKAWYSAALIGATTLCSCGCSSLQKMQTTSIKTQYPTGSSSQLNDYLKLHQKKSTFYHWRKDQSLLFLKAFLNFSNAMHPCVNSLVKGSVNTSLRNQLLKPEYL